MIATNLYVTRDEVCAALDRFLGLPPDLLARVVEVWALERRDHDEFRTLGGAGHSAWDQATRTLRLGATDFGFVVRNERGVPLAVNPDRGVAVQVLAGDGGAGDPARNASTKNPRERIARQVALGQQQLNLFKSATERPAPRYRETWIILPCFDLEGALRYEVSCAAYINKGRVTTWRDRIFPQFPESRRGSAQVPEPTDEIVLNVRRR
jgi:hypothetical protein